MKFKILLKNVEWKKIYWKRLLLFVQILLKNNDDLLNILFLKRKIIHYKIIRIFKISIDIQNSFLIDLYEGKR